MNYRVQIHESAFLLSDDEMMNTLTLTVNKYKNQNRCNKYVYPTPIFTEKRRTHSQLLKVGNLYNRYR